MLRPNFDLKKIERYLNDSTKMTENTFYRALVYIAEQVITEARRSQGYHDHTGNLRNSTGYVIAYNGQVKKMVFDQTHAGVPKGGIKNGKAVGRRLAMKLVENYPEGFVLIVVAGMSYASYVEAKGSNVLHSAEKLAQKEVPRILNEIMRQR